MTEQELIAGQEEPARVVIIGATHRDAARDRATVDRCAAATHRTSRQ